MRRREPCTTCGLPVFIAQRLVVNGHLYHRTCFRCARCSAQLSLANYYETLEGVYCCETCPDEEERNKITYNEISDKDGGTVSDLCSDIKPVYIENEDNSRIGKNAELKTAIEKTESLVSSRTASLVGLRRMMFENISHTDDEKLPKLKKLISDKSDNLAFKSASSVLDGNEVKCDKSSTVMDKVNKYNFSENVSDSKDQLSGHDVSSKVDINKRRFSDISFIDEGDVKDSFIKECVDARPITDEISNKFSLENSKQIEKSPSTVESEAILVPDQVDSSGVGIEGTTQLLSVEKSDVDVSELKSESGSESNSLVETKNHLVKTSSFDQKDNDTQYSSLVEAKNSFELAVTERKFGSKEDIECKPEVSSGLNIKGKSSDNEHFEIKNSTPSLDFEEKDSHDESPVIEAKNDLVQVNLKQDTSLTYVKQEVEGDEIISESTNRENQIKIDADSKLFVPKPAPRREHRHKLEQGRQKSYTLPAPVVVVSKGENKKSNTLEYPDELNPFGNDDEENDVSITVSEHKKSTNPFDSSSDEEEVKEDSPKRVLKKIEVPKHQLNPFWSEGEESSDEEIHHQAPPPVPLPRKLKSPQATPEPSPLPRNKLKPSTGALGSATSLTFRKKKPAPQPPKFQTLQNRKTADVSPVAPKKDDSIPPPLPTTAPPSITPPSSLPYTPPTIEKDNKDSFNRQRQNSESSSIGYTPHKSTYGQWKRKKGPAPPRPIPQKRTVRPMPMKEIRQELDDIEIKQQELERQGVKLEQTIREKCEQDSSMTPYVEELVLQLFELVNEKNELFRRQAELMYLRRQHNLEEEHAELEYQIRCLMLCPEHNKTDSDKAREEELIQRLIEVVERRDEIVQCLDMDRLREAEEDRSVNMQLGIFSAAMGSELDLRVKTDKKEKKSKKEKRAKKSGIDMDKDIDETEREKKKNKKKWFTLHHLQKKM